MPNPVDELLWQLLTSVPRVNQNLAVVVFLLNIILPGFGTMLATCFAKNDGIVSKAQICCGLLQFLTSFFLVGWIWSIYWGYLILKESQNPDEEHTQKVLDH